MMYTVSCRVLDFPWLGFICLFVYLFICLFVVSLFPWISKEDIGYPRNGWKTNEKEKRKGNQT